MSSFHVCLKRNAIGLRLYKESFYNISKNYLKIRSRYFILLAEQFTVSRQLMMCLWLGTVICVCFI